MNGMKWTDDLTERAKQLNAQGLRPREIAIELGNGISRKAVIGKFNRLGIALAFAGQHSSGRPRKKRASGPVTEQPYLNIPFIDLEPHHCRFLRGDDAPFLFCGQQKIEDSSYCGFHHSICHTKPATKEQCEEAAREYQARAA